MGHLRVTWHDKGREPQCAPNPAFPDGAVVDFAQQGTGVAPVVHPYGDLYAPVIGATCETRLPYPAARCGTYVIECSKCGLSVACTTAGRPDDPRLARLPCKERAH